MKKQATDRPARGVASEYPDITDEMVAAGIAYFESATEDRFPQDWPLAKYFVVGLYRAMRVIAETRAVDPPDPDSGAPGSPLAS